MQLLSFLAVLALAAQAPVTLFEIELWPGEGRPEFQAVAYELVIRERPSASAAVTRRLGVTRGQHLAFDETRYRTTESSRIQVLVAASVTGRVLGAVRRLTSDRYYKGRFPTQAIAVEPGDVIEYFQERAEGTCFVQIADQVIDADPCPVQDERSFRLNTQPKTEWWIRVVVDRLPVGWAMVDGSAIQESGRSF